MPALSRHRRAVAVLTALAATSAFATSSAIATAAPEPTVAAPTVVQDRQAKDSDAVKPQFDARSMQVAPKADGGTEVRITLRGPQLRVGQRLNLMDVTILNGSGEQAWRAFWLFPKDGDNVAGLRLFDVNQADAQNPFGKRVRCPRHKGVRSRGANGLSIQMNIPRSCIADPAKIRVNGKLWYVVEYRRSGAPKEGFSDGVPTDSDFTRAL